MQMLTLTRT